MIKRSAGILLPITSLPSPYGIGCFDRAAYQFVDWLSCAGQSYWQILPLGPTSFGDSPYQSFSTFAGNPYFISLEEFIKEGLLTKEACDSADLETEVGFVDYAKQFEHRFPLLKIAFERSELRSDPNFTQFCKENDWLDDYALFMAIKDMHGGLSWNEWEEGLRFRDAETIARFKAEHGADVEFYMFLQYRFFNQWKQLKGYANEHGIKIIGDIPIYVAYDSADTWTHPELFQLDEKKLPKAVAGCPPDGFSEDGQLWGNPLYDWRVHESSGFSWWIKRLAHCFQLYDVVRIDHFRGFDEYYSIPYGEKTARNGRWEQGPGIKLFDAIKKSIGEKAFIAEDLGFMTESVKALVNQTGFPNMKVLEFAFDARDSGGTGEHLPHNYDTNCVAYTGTHDNQTLASWYQTITSEERGMVRDYLCNHDTADSELTESLIALVLRSKANLAIIPMQDWLSLDDKARINVPSTVGENWKWRLTSNQWNHELCREIEHMTKLFGRCNS